MIPLCDKVMLSFPFNELSTKVKEENLAALPNTAEYVARKPRSYNDCNAYNDLFGNKESIIDLIIGPKYLEYIDYFDRDGLQIYLFKSYKYHIIFLMYVLLGNWKNHSYNLGIKNT